MCFISPEPRLPQAPTRSQHILRRSSQIHSSVYFLILVYRSQLYVDGIHASKTMSLNTEFPGLILKVTHKSKTQSYCQRKASWQESSWSSAVMKLRRSARRQHNHAQKTYPKAKLALHLHQFSSYFRCQILTQHKTMCFCESGCISWLFALTWH